MELWLAETVLPLVKKKSGTHCSLSCASRGPADLLRWWPRVRPALALAVALGLALTWAGPAWTQPYHAGDVLSTNLALQNRLRWTNDTGQVYTPSNTTIRLHDFDGKIVFFCFFDVW
ncbi:MAG TPA: hypothetical protein VNM37_24800 [Candidatus Dormibacteraeota bacterium]|nr:hypothetical protein [Candidatus Dormibacteraeota bacterium]